MLWDHYHRHKATVFSCAFSSSIDRFLTFQLLYPKLPIRRIIRTVLETSMNCWKHPWIIDQWCSGNSFLLSKDQEEQHLLVPETKCARHGWTGEGEWSLLALHVAGPVLKAQFLALHMAIQASQGIFPEYRIRSKPWAPPGMTQTNKQIDKSRCTSQTDFLSPLCWEEGNSSVTQGHHCC